MEQKLTELLRSTKKCIDFFERQKIFGVVEYLELAVENIESSIEEYEEYSDSGE